MNTLTNIHAARRYSSGVVRIPVPAGLIDARSRARRAVVCAWSIDPATGRLVCSWAEAAKSEPQCLEQDAQHPPPFAIPLAA